MVNILGVTPIEFFFMYYRVYTLKHCWIILLHSYINYYTKYLIWCYGYNFYRIQRPISHYTGQPKCPIGIGSNSNYQSSQLQT